jgi:hypothetical protein
LPDKSPKHRAEESIVKALFKILISGAAAAGLAMTGCNSAPDLTRTSAQTVIQSHYDSQAPSGLTIMVDKVGLQQGLTAGYWKLTKVYPNQRWADYTLTPEAKKVLKLSGGGDVIQWRPEQDGDFHFLIETTSANTMRARDVQDPQDEILANTKSAKSVAYTESVNMDGVPQPLQDMAHNRGNRLSSKKQADLSYENGAWKVHGIV